MPMSVLVLCGVVLLARGAGADPTGDPPEGFSLLFNGKDLSGWRGCGHVNPMVAAKWSATERRKKQAAADEDLHEHWRVDRGEIVNDGQGVFLTTEKDYADFELLIDWKITAPNSDSGIYLRGCPQVQIWDANNPRQQAHGAGKGSGGLWNNNSASGRFPLVKADNPVGAWNTFRIRMVGPRVTVWLNGKLVVDNAVMENFWNRQRDIFPTGPIQLQTHGGGLRFRRIFIRDVGPSP